MPHNKQSFNFNMQIISVSLVLVIVTPFFIFPNIVFALPPDQTKVILKPPSDKITVTKYFGFFATNDRDIAKITIENINGVLPSNIVINKTGFILTDKSSFVSAPKFLDSEKISINYFLSDKSNHSLIIDISLNDTIQNEGTYSGKLIINGTNFDQIPLDIEIVFAEHPLDLLLFTIIGLIASAGIGIVLTIMDKIEEHEKLINDDSDIISHINGHIREINKIRQYIKEEYWKYLCDVFEIKKTTIEKYRDRLELDPNAESVIWFEKVTQTISERYIENIVHKDREFLPEIKKPKEQSELKNYDKKKQEAIWNKVKSDMRPSRKYVYVIVTAVLAIPTSLFITDNFVGLSSINLLLAFITGFSIYRIQNVKDIFKS